MLVSIFRPGDGVKPNTKMPVKMPTEQEIKQADQEYLVKHNIKVRRLTAHALRLRFPWHPRATRMENLTRPLPTPQPPHPHAGSRKILEQELMAGMLKEIVMTKPQDPVQYMVDYMVMDEGMASQDKYGLSKYRRGKLLDIFNLMDKNGSGAVDYKVGNV